MVFYSMYLTTKPNGCPIGRERDRNDGPRRPAPRLSPLPPNGTACATQSWLSCVNVVHAHVGYARMGTNTMSAPHAPAIRGAHLAAAALWRTLDPAFDVDEHAFGQVILAWAALTTAVALGSRCVSVRRLPALHATTDVEARKRETFLLNGRLFPAGEDAPSGFVVDRALAEASTRELSRAPGAPLWLVVAAILLAAGGCALYAYEARSVSVSFSAALAMVLGGFAIVGAGLVMSVATWVKETVEHAEGF